MEIGLALGVRETSASQRHFAKWQAPYTDGLLPQPCASSRGTHYQSRLPRYSERLRSDLFRRGRRNGCATRFWASGSWNFPGLRLNSAGGRVERGWCVFYRLAPPSLEGGRKSHIHWM